MPGPTSHGSDRRPTTRPRHQQDRRPLEVHGPRPLGELQAAPVGALGGGKEAPQEGLRHLHATACGGAEAEDEGLGRRHVVEGELREPKASVEAVFGPTARGFGP